MTTIVFLHIPKTAGQTIHNELARLVGKDQVSPIRTHTQAPDGKPQMPAGYRLYSGHIDWTEMNSLPTPRFVFSVLRDPKERIASFYFYLLNKSRNMSEQELAESQAPGVRTILAVSVDDYFFGGDDNWHKFVLGLYDNFYCTYFATRSFRGRPDIIKITRPELLNQAEKGARQINRVYSTAALEALEDDIEQLTGSRINVAGNYFNTGEMPPQESRWNKLMGCFESDALIRRIEAFVESDEILMTRLGFGSP